MSGRKPRTLSSAETFKESVDLLPRLATLPPAMSPPIVSTFLSDSIVSNETESKIMIPKMIRVQNRISIPYMQIFKGNSGPINVSNDIKGQTAAAAICIPNQVIVIGKSHKNMLSVSVSQIPGVFSTAEYKDAPYERSLFSLCLINPTKIILIGGESQAGVDYDVYLLDLEQKRWKSVKMLGPVTETRTRFASSSITWRNKTVVYAFGGQCSDEFNSQLDIIIFDNDNLNDEQLFCGFSRFKMENGPSPRSDHTMLTYQNRIYLFGGLDTNGYPLGDLWELSYTTSPLFPTWTLISAIGPSPRYKHVSYVKDNALFIAGGNNENCEPAGDVWKYFSGNWQREFVFECSLPLIGTPNGLFSYASRLSSVNEMKLSKTLGNKFNELKRAQSEHSMFKSALNESMSVISQSISDIKGLINNLPLDGKYDNETLSKALSFYDNRAFLRIKSDLVSLRHEFIGSITECLKLSPSIMRHHLTTSSLQNYSSQIQKKVKAVSTKRELINSERLKEIEILQYRFNNESLMNIVFDPLDINGFFNSISKMEDKQRVSAIQIYQDIQNYQLIYYDAELKKLKSKESKVQQYNSKQMHCLVQIQSNISQLLTHIQKSSIVHQDLKQRYEKNSVYISAFHCDTNENTRRIAEIQARKNSANEELKQMIVSIVENDRETIESLSNFAHQINQSFKQNDSRQAIDELNLMKKSICTLLDQFSISTKCE